MAKVIPTRRRLQKILLDLAEDEALTPSVRLRAARHAQDLLRPEKKPEVKVKPRKRKDVLGLRSI